MKNNSSKYILLLVSILVLVTLACGSSTTEQLEEAIAPSSTPEIEEQEEIQPEATSTLEPTEDPEPIDTPQPTDELPAAPLVTIIGGNVNIRSGPGTEYPVIQALVEGNTAPATGINSGRSWFQIELPDGKIGWVGSDLAEIQNSDEIEIVTDIPPRACCCTF